MLWYVSTSTASNEKCHTWGTGPLLRAARIRAGARWVALVWTSTLPKVPCRAAARSTSRQIRPK